MPINDLTAEAQEIVDLAFEIARKRKDEELDSAHLLYALFEKSQAGKDWLKHMGIIDSQPVLEELERVFDEWYKEKSEYPEPSADYLRIMHLSSQLAQAENVGAIMPHHILAATLKLDQRLAERLFENNSIPNPNLHPSQTPLLDEVSRDLTALAKEGTLPRFIGREKEIQHLIEILLSHGKNSALILGPAGTGKTAIVEGLAQQIVAGKVPEKLLSLRLVELNLASLLAGTSFRGEFEERMQSILKELLANRNIVLVIDEFHALVGTGKTVSSGPDAVSILKPYLARGDITCIGITTNEEFVRFVESDTALVRRFQQIIIEEPTTKEALQILQGVSEGYSSYHQIEIPDQTLETIVHLAERYLTSRRFPDKAFDLLGKACARAELQHESQVSPAMIAEILTEITGIPVGELNLSFKTNLLSLESHLNDQVIGQDEAITIVCQAVRLSYSNLRDPNRPKGVFLFIGPSGVGKTELAKSLAINLFGSEKALIRFDMSEYSERINMSRLIGSAPGYIGYEESGQLTQAIRDHPYAVVLFDEVEKAYADVFDLFLQLFDEGRITDSHGHLADGKNCIFIMTSNLSIRVVSQSELGFIHSQKEPTMKIDKSELTSYFRPEFLNRIDHIIQFRNLDQEDLIKICKLEVERLSTRLEETGVKLTYDSSVLKKISIESEATDKGARGVKDVVENRLMVPISDFLLSKQNEQQNAIHITVEDSQISLEWI